MSQWSKQQLQILKEKYPLQGATIPELLKTKTATDIKKKANSIGLRKNAPKPWTKEELQILCKYYEMFGSHICNLIPNHSKTSIRKKAMRMGLRSGNKVSDHDLGLWFPNKSGLDVRIISRDANFASVEFKDGTIKRVNLNVDIKKLCTTSHPALNSRTKKFYGFTTKYADTINGNVYYEAACSKCEYKDILTPQQMQEHTKTCENTKITKE